MDYVMQGPTETLSNIADFCLQSTARFGGNGTSWLPPELVASTPTTQLATSRVLWDDDLTDGLDTSQVYFAFEADFSWGTTTSFDVDNGSSTPLSYTGEFDGATGPVIIRAGAQVPADVSFSGLTITFWEGASLGEVLCLSQGPHIDTTNSETGVGEQILVVTPGSPKWNRITVTGTLQFTAAPEVMPSYCDIFGQVLIMNQ